VDLIHFTSHQGCSGDDVENFRKRISTDVKNWPYLSIAHDAMPDRELDEQWLLKNYGIAVHMYAHISSMREAIDGPDCVYALAPLAKLNHERVPMDSTFL